MAACEEFAIGAHNRPNRSTVGNWLALRPQFSTHQARMPPTARPAPRGERPGVTGFYCGAGAGFLSELSDRPVVASQLDERSGILAALRPAAPTEGRKA